MEEHWFHQTIPENKVSHYTSWGSVSLYSLKESVTLHFAEKSRPPYLWLYMLFTNILFFCSFLYWREESSLPETLLELFFDQRNLL